MSDTTTTVTFTVTLTVEGDTDQMSDMFGQYLTESDAPLAEDYGRGWGGWDGPWIRAVEVRTQSGKVYASDEKWPEPDREGDEDEDEEEE